MGVKMWNLFVSKIEEGDQFIGRERGAGAEKNGRACWIEGGRRAPAEVSWDMKSLIPVSDQIQAPFVGCDQVRRNSGTR